MTALPGQRLSFLPEQVDPFRIELAPLYDVSSADGQGEGYTRDLPLPIEGISDPEEVSSRTWLEWANATDQEPKEVLDHVLAVARDLPDALSDTASHNHEFDDFVDEQAAKRRLREVIDGTHRRCQATACP